MILFLFFKLGRRQADILRQQVIQQTARLLLNDCGREDLRQWG